MRYIQLLFVILSVYTLTSCSSDREKNEEQISVREQEPPLADTSMNNVIKGDLSLQQLEGYPSNVILTGLKDQRLVTVHRDRKTTTRSEDSDYYSSNSHYAVEEFEDDRYVHFMPGIDLLYGYNLLNVAHYDLAKEKLSFLFSHPVLVKSLYFPSFIQDSINKQPINRDYYLLSVYDADTNNDSLINKFDLRRFYYFNATASERIALLPLEYSAVRSEYDRANDLMYIFARQDANKNGSPEKKEPLHIFWIDLKKPIKATRLY